MANNGWTTISFADAMTVNPSIRLEKGKVYPFVEMAAVDPGSRSVCESEYREFDGGGARFAPGDTLMARITPCLENGKIARFQPTDRTSIGFGSTEFIVIRGRPGVTTDDFAYYLTKWPEFRQYAVGQMTGSSGRQRVPAESLADFQMTIPPLSVQRRIADVLGKLDDKIELNRRMNRTLEKMAAAIFKSWFIDFDPVHAKADLPAGRQAAETHLNGRQATPTSPPRGVWVVYALECENGSIYIGHTQDLEQRFEQHATGKGAEWTKRHPPKRIAYWEEVASETEAVNREKKLKTGSGREWLKAEIARRDLARDCLPALSAGLPAEIADLFPDSLEESELGQIPKGWKVATMKDLVDVNARSINIKKGYPQARIRYVDISSVSQGSLDQTTTYDLAEAPSRAKRLVQTGDTIWSCVRPNRKAYLYIDRPDDNLVVSTGFAVLSPRAVPASYLHQWVTTQAFVDYLTAYATGAAYPAVKADTFDTAKMLLPGKGILKAFHDLVGPLRTRIAHNQRQNRCLAALRDTLLPKLMSGEIEIPAAEAVAEGVT